MSDRKVTPMDQEAKERIMSSEYKKNDGQATEWSRRAQSGADKNLHKENESDQAPRATLHS